MKTLFTTALILVTGIFYSQTCFISNFSSLGNLTKYSGNVYIDQVMSKEWQFLVQKFGVMPDIYYYHEQNGSNAYATTTVYNQNFKDGTVAVGFGLIRDECAQSQSGSCISVAIIMAHEFAHIVDFKYNIQLEGKYAELFADYLAGCYMHLRSLQYGYTNISEAARTFYRIGDYQFNSPGHHGTPEQRYNTLMAGYNYSQLQTMNNYAYTLADAVNNAVLYVRGIN
ncbi:neutral zinc metallopeptidase [Elizabethkingia meningoseptica]|uniref:metalloprotease n=1 Tax=Elizabethkingia meningoseptica TaxID=238 RepID=UPI0023B189F5|nr:metalloprotease [Elizabethkingia meningoseptica]MDE5467124.1 neutral zinc metallopeptidase [Elizabethkingia meningoseptica]MDE5473646.1 neutral zinc metallopeptidase [Elizabethkingia meningoseptica]MDE5477079.1 neutral zinc metallopeptidase [Elizabethkingia meningoseptica]MDE5484443.1 neutral zinc metallopeptidase [Elizabethkingia meningoseptica]MDE5500479.1 neutral zinc metallopeptidase [Elizabethkingia meningoseptica]